MSAESPDYTPHTTGVIRLPSLGLEFELMSDIDAGPAHNVWSSLPGEPGTCDVAAHRSGPFRHLGHLRAGDEVFVGLTTVGDGVLRRYVVTGPPAIFPEYHPVLSPWRKELFDRLGIPGPAVHVPSYCRLLLQTCSSREGLEDPDDNSHRIVAFAELHEVETR